MDRRKISQFFILIIMILMIITILPSFSLAYDPDDPDYGGGGGDGYIGDSKSPIDNPNAFKPGAITNEDTNVITSKANQIIGAIVTIGVVVSAITLTILGIKYMIGSVEEKAEYKKSMIPYIIGSVLVFATSSILGVIGKLIEGINF